MGKPAAAWERSLRLGQAEEAKGRLEPAERAYREALAANPDFDSLQIEFARFLENSGRAKEAEAHLLRALELGWPRAEGEATLARLRGKPAAAAPPAAGDAAWPQAFSTLLCEGRYPEAFALADASLAKSARLSNANAFLWPWWSKVSSRYSGEKLKFCAQELERVRKARASGAHPGWFAYCSGVLLLTLGRGPEAMAEYRRVSPRRSIMHHPFVMHRLLAGDLKWTIARCRALLKNAPDYWWFQCRLAEALMADGDAAAGLREFARAEKGAADDAARRSIMTWHGAALLWSGRYRRALSKLDASAASGTVIWVHCWRGGARLKLGLLDEAMADLDLAIKTDPEDLEAHLWRGEALRLLGRPAEALRDLDRAIALDAGYTWGYFNRALARGDAGDDKGMAADFAMIPESVLAAVRGRAPASAPGPKEMRAVLEAGLARAKGIRRPEPYLNSMWMNGAL